MRIANGLLGLLAGIWLAGAPHAQAATATGGDTIAIQDLTLTVPTGWTLKQDAKDEGTIILGFAKGTQSITIFVKQATDIDMKAMFATNGATVVRDVRTVPYNGHTWNVLETSKRLGSRTNYVASFLGQHEGHSYYGYSRGDASPAALQAVEAFLGELR
jgi:hypothetical protein